MQRHLGWMTAGVLVGTLFGCTYDFLRRERGASERLPVRWQYAQEYFATNRLKRVLVGSVVGAAIGIGIETRSRRKKARLHREKERAADAHRGQE